MTSREVSPLTVEIFSFYPSAKTPERASRSVGGSLPSRAVERCPPISEASSMGWYLYPPIDFALRWDGQETEWSLLEENEPVEWKSLAGGYHASLTDLDNPIANLPEHMHADADIFDVVDRRLPFLDADPRSQNTIEVTTGTVARTSEGWCLLARGVPNWPSDGGHQVLEGLIESDWYRSTIPTILRLTTPNKVVRFYRNVPLMLLEPVHRSTFAALRGATLTTRPSLAEWPEDIWAEFVAMRRQRQNPDVRGAYRREQHKRARGGVGYQPVIGDDPADGDTASAGTAPRP